MSRINGFIGRRKLLKTIGLGSLTLTAITSCSQLTQKSTTTIFRENFDVINANKALQILLAGNQRFVNQQSQHPERSKSILAKLAQEQYPFAAILGCADSRVPAETIFDQGIGDLFVVRVAGNVADDVTIGSLEYTTSILGTPLIVVLGHERCGAVEAALAKKTASGKINSIIAQIKPALINVENIGDNAVLANIKYQVQKLQRKSTILNKLVKAGKLKIVGAIYDLDTGRVKFLS